jgi:pimeloyl-ACP methyl ester carboxylesterase
VVEPVTPAVVTRTTIELVLRFASGGWTRPRRRDVDQYWAPSQFDEYAKACRACAHSFNWKAAPATVLRSLRVPTLVISGTRDRIVFGALQRAQLIPMARIVSIRKAGHIVLQESSERVNAELIDFLRSRAA